MAETSKINDVRRLRAIAHPLRVRLYYALSAQGAATPSALAELVDESVALVSYHLHQLAKHGFISSDPQRARDGRERWWRANSDGFRWRSSDFANQPEGLAAAAALRRSMAEHQMERLARFLDGELGWGKSWSDAAFSSDILLQLTPADLAALYDELQAVLQRWREYGLAARGGNDTHTSESLDDTPAHVMIFLHGFPFKP